MLENLKIKAAYDGFIFLAESRRNPPILRTHHHRELELNLVIQGSISYVISGRTYTFHKGSLLWIFPNQVHQLVDRTPDASYYIAVFKPSLIQRACKDKRYQDLKRKSVKTGGVLKRVLANNSFQFLQKMMDSLMEHALDPDILNRESGFGLNSKFQFEHGDPDMLNAGLHYLLIQCWKLYSSENFTEVTPKLHPGIQKALQNLSNPSFEANLQELSKTCGMSSSYLSRLFHSQMGISLNRYRNSLRLHHFIQIYSKSPSKNFYEASSDAGFGSYNQFHKVFYDTYRIGPREFFNQSRPKINH